MNRDEPAQRSKPNRPRDELGRPLPKGSANRLALDDFDALSMPENHELAIAYWTADRFFEAHEAWETCWNQARGGPEEELFKGLAQLAAGYTHYRRGNARGAAVLIMRALNRIGGYPDGHRGLAILELVSQAAEQARSLELAAGTTEELPSLTTPLLAVSH